MSSNVAEHNGSNLEYVIATYMWQSHVETLFRFNWVNLYSRTSTSQARLIYVVD